MRFDNSFLESIRNRISVSEVVSRRVTWDRRKSQPARGDYWACCPFHSEKTPSFHVDDRRGIYKCFGCGASGDQFKFICETEGVSFPEAVERLAEEAGIELPRQDKAQREKAQKQKSLFDVMEIASRYFENNLRAPLSAHVRYYLETRQIRPEIQNEFRFGFAPDSWDGLKNHLGSAGVPESDMIEAGLCIKAESGRVYDRFRNRVMIPIQDNRGRVIAFGGRALDKETEPKYLNSPETPLFSKGHNLFNAHRARKPAFDAGRVLVTEGYLDAIAVYQAGISDVVATLGTAFTPDQIRQLWKFAAEPIICFDGDAAGIAAAYRACERILPVLEAGKSFNFIFLPDGQDPDDLIKEAGVDAFSALLGRAQPLVDIIWQREIAASDTSTPERKAALEKRLHDLAELIENPSIKERYKSTYRARLRDHFFRSERTFFKKGSKHNTDAAPGGANTPSPALGHRRHLEEIILGICIHSPSIFEQYQERLMLEEFPDNGLNALKARLYLLLSEKVDLTAEEISNLIGSEYDALFDGVYGKADPSSGRALGHTLLRNFPILRSKPPELYTSRVFDLFLEMFRLRVMEQELADFNRQISADMSQEDEHFSLTLASEIRRKRTEIARSEADLEDEAKLIVAAHKSENSELSINWLKSDSETVRKKISKAM